jgi:hypothetical protein
MLCCARLDGCQENKKRRATSWVLLRRRQVGLSSVSLRGYRLKRRKCVYTKIAMSKSYSKVSMKVREIELHVNKNLIALSEMHIRVHYQSTV